MNNTIVRSRADRSNQPKWMLQSYIGVAEDVFKELSISLGRAVTLVAAVADSLQLGGGGLHISVAQRDDQPAVGAPALRSKSAVSGSRHHT